MVTHAELRAPLVVIAVTRASSSSRLSLSFLTRDSKRPHKHSPLLNNEAHSFLTYSSLGELLRLSALSVAHEGVYDAGAGFNGCGISCLTEGRLQGGRYERAHAEIWNQLCTRRHCQGWIHSRARTRRVSAKYARVSREDNKALDVRVRVCR